MPFGVVGEDANADEVMMLKGRFLFCYMQQWSCMCPHTGYP